MKAFKILSSGIFFLRKIWYLIIIFIPCTCYISIVPLINPLSFSLKSKHHHICYIQLDRNKLVKTAHILRESNQPLLLECIRRGVRLWIYMYILNQIWTSFASYFFRYFWWPSLSCPQPKNFFVCIAGLSRLSTILM